MRFQSRPRPHDSQSSNVVWNCQTFKMRIVDRFSSIPLKFGCSRELPVLIADSDSDSELTCITPLPLSGSDPDTPVDLH